MKKISLREKSILAGLYLSKFDAAGLRQLGFRSFIEAFNVIGFALGVQPGSIKNYRDEFDPLFPNDRKGWHKRPMRHYCEVIYDNYAKLELDEFSVLLKQLIYKRQDVDTLIEEVEKEDGNKKSSFAQRLITGQAAEQYFLSKYKEIELFKDFEIEDTTKLGCGFDFKLTSQDLFYGVEVKGMNEAKGSISLTNKEYSMASLMGDRYFLFVVRNFKETPFHNLYLNPLGGELSFNRVEQKIIQVSWLAKL
ncbi:MAG: DUF3883 domain-containing protein [Sulfuricellaceae bacterium]